MDVHAYDIYTWEVKAEVQIHPALLVSLSGLCLRLLSQTKPNQNKTHHHNKGREAQ